MKRVFLLIFSLAFTLNIVGIDTTQASTYNIAPKAPKISPALKPIIVKYKNEDYTGAMLDLEDLVKVEKNNTYAKYYLALCYTRLGFKEESKILYNEVVKKDDNLTLSHYSRKALTCLENPNDESCKPPKVVYEESPEMTDIESFIRSGRKIHPAAMDRITKEKLDRKLKEEEYLKQQQDADNRVSAVPTNEDIAAALNTLSRLGMNPFTQQNNNYNLANMNNQFYGLLNNTGYQPQMMGNMNPEITKMLLQTQFNQNGLGNYGM